MRFSPAADSMPSGRKGHLRPLSMTRRDVAGLIPVHFFPLHLPGFPSTVTGGFDPRTGLDVVG